MGLLGKKGGPAAWVRVASLGQFTNSLCVRHNGREFALFKLGAEVHCLDNSCSHEYSPLCEGEIMGGEVYCLKHGSRFDIRTGQVRNFPATEDVKTHQVKVEGDEIWILV